MDATEQNNQFEYNQGVLWGTINPRVKGKIIKKFFTVFSAFVCEKAEINNS